jgi:hypothetical protein
MLSGTGAHGEFATFDVWVEAFGAELLLFPPPQTTVSTTRYSVI